MSNLETGELPRLKMNVFSDFSEMLGKTTLEMGRLGGGERTIGIFEIFNSIAKNGNITSEVIDRIQKAAMYASDTGKFRVLLQLLLSDKTKVTRKKNPHYEPVKDTEHMKYIDIVDNGEVKIEIDNSNLAHPIKFFGKELIFTIPNKVKRIIPD